MKKIIPWIALFTITQASASEGHDLLLRQYETSCKTPSDINEHVSHLYELAKECSSVAQIGIAGFVPVWGCLYGLENNLSNNREFFLFDPSRPSEYQLDLAETLSDLTGIQFNFNQGEEVSIEMKNVDMLFIDSLHTYVNVTYLLNQFADQVGKYIALHDTSEPYGFEDCLSYKGNYSEYPSWIDRNKKGVWKAIWDFLSDHPEWELSERHFNNHGFTILKRADEAI